MSDTKTQKYKYVVSLRFKNGSKAYTFGTDDETIEYGNYLVVETSQGLELGECISSLRDSSIHVSDMELKPILRNHSFIEPMYNNIADDLREKSKTGKI